MSRAADTRTVRDPSTGDSYEVQERAPAELSDPGASSRDANPRRAGNENRGAASHPPPLRLVLLDGIVCGEARLSTEIWEVLEARGFSRKDAIALTMRAEQRPDRILIETGKRK